MLRLCCVLQPFCNMVRSSMLRWSFAFACLHCIFTYDSSSSTAATAVVQTSEHSVCVVFYSLFVAWRVLGCCVGLLCLHVSIAFLHAIVRLRLVPPP